MSKKRFFGWSKYLVLVVVLASLLTLLIPVSVVKADSVVSFPDLNLEAARREAYAAGPEPYFASESVQVCSYDLYGKIIRIELFQDVTNGGGPGEVFVSVTCDCHELTASKVFYMDEGETMQVQAVFTGYFGTQFFCQCTWIGRVALPSDIPCGEVAVHPKAWLGVTTLTVTPDVQAQYGLSVDSGVLVWSVVAGSPAANAGLQAYDIIIKFGDMPITRTEDLHMAIVRYSPGDLVTITYVRGQSTLTCEVVLGQKPSAANMEGDVSGNGHVTISDALMIAQYKAGMITLTANQLLCADTNDDGIVSMADAMHIAQWLVDPTGSLGVLQKPLWQSPADDSMLQPV